MELGKPGVIMKVIHLIGGGDTGGAKTHVLNLLRELNKHIDAEIICFRQGEFSQEAAQMGVPCHVIDSGSVRVGLRELKRYLADKPVDIIHCHGARGNLMGNLIKKWAKAPVVTTVHSDYRLDYLGRLAARLTYGTINTIALRRVNYYIGVADPMADLLIERSFRADRIYTIYNGIDFATPLETVDREEFLRSLGMEVAPGDVIAGIAARLNPVKDYPTLLKALAIAVKEAPQLKLVAAGDGEDRTKLEQLASDLGIAERVCFAGWVTDINSFYHAIDINLLTSVSETFPYALTEGARMHRATIASRVGGVPVLIDDRKNGFIFTPGNEQELAEYLIRLANDGQLRQKMGDALYEKASTSFSIESMVRRQLGIYENILAREERKKTHPKRDGVIICGAYGYGNAGDDAILKAIIQATREIDPTIPVTVLAKNTESIKKRYRVHSIQTLSILKILLALRRSTLYINGGGTLIQNATSHRSLWYYLFTLRAAHFLGNKVDMYGCGIGPVQGNGNIRLVRRVLDRSVDRITVREPASQAELASYGVRKPRIELSSDPALALEPAPLEDARAFLEQHGADPEGAYLCLMLRTWYGFSDKAEDIATAVNEACQKYGLTALFLSLNVVHDAKAANQIIPHLKVPYLLINDSADPEVLISVLSRMKITVAMRLHGLILSSVSGVPLVGISYDPKIGAFLQYLGTGSCFDLKEVTRENLTAAIDAAAEQIPRQAELQRKAEALRAVESTNRQAVRDLLEHP